MTTLTRTIKVLIVDDHSLFRQGLKRLLESEGDFLVQGECSTVDTGLEILRSFPVDIVLLDFDLGLQRGFEFQTRAAAERIDRPVLIVTAGLSQDDAGMTLALGARGIFVKHNSAAALATAIRRVVAGDEWIDARYAPARGYGDRPSAPSEEVASPVFSDRETSVLRGILHGLSNKEIAETLGVSEPSVKAAIQRLFQKTDVRTRGQLVRVALERFSEEL